MSLRIQALLQVLSTGVLAALLLIVTPTQAAESDAAQKLWMSGKRAEAVSMLEESLRKTPTELDLRFALGVMRM
ncbi:MAG: hypothetical protein K2W93_20670, partial [Burkholderiaceae bacterium]|nr:hypothetical protein [Burkholderiaceae bacterium]